MWHRTEGLKIVLVRPLQSTSLFGCILESIFQQKILALISGEIENDSLCLECLRDLSSTAAIVKEIIFNNKFDNKESFLSLDFGSGSGILLAASLIAARRQMISNIVGIGIEKENIAVIRSRRVLAKLPVFTNVVNGDITDPNVYKELAKYQISYWISETISLNTPPIQISNNKIILPEQVNPIRSMMSTVSYNLDPFPIVLKLSCEHIPRFMERVREGKIAMFPDIIRGKYKPDHQNPTIILNTVDQFPRPLKKIGEEFEKYEYLENGEKRW